MRVIVMASLALFPALLHAQASSPAPLQAVNKTPVFSSSMMAAAASPAAAASTPLRVSTGVMSPRLVVSGAIAESSKWNWAPTETEKTAVVHMTVEADGTPSHISVVQGIGGAMDQDLVASVAQYRFEPAQLNHQAVPLELSLTLRIQGPRR